MNLVSLHQDPFGWVISNYSGLQEPHMMMSVEKKKIIHLYSLAFFCGHKITCRLWTVVIPSCTSHLCDIVSNVPWNLGTDLIYGLVNGSLAAFVTWKFVRTYTWRAGLQKKKKIGSEYLCVACNYAPLRLALTKCRPAVAECLCRSLMAGAGTRVLCSGLTFIG